MKTLKTVMLIGLLYSIRLSADGFIIPEPGINVAVKYHHVTVMIENQVAHTEIDQVFLNDTDLDSVEAMYVFPLPEGATFTKPTSTMTSTALSDSPD